MSCPLNPNTWYGASDGRGNLASISGVGANPTVEDCARAPPPRERESASSTRVVERAVDAMAMAVGVLVGVRGESRNEEGQEESACGVRPGVVREKKTRGGES